MDGSELPQNYDTLEAVSVSDFGAIPDDGKDDTAAFQKALQTKGKRLIKIPKGTFELSDRLILSSPMTILQGESRDQTILLFTKGLEEVDPKPTKNSGGTPTTSYSWSGGFLGISGKTNLKKLPPLSMAAKRGSLQLSFKAPPNVQPGDRIHIRQYAGEDMAVIKHLYAGDPGTLDNMKKRDGATLVAKVKQVRGNTVHLDRRLLCDVNPQWGAVISILKPTVQYSGIENLSITFPAHRYGGHFKEKGYNAINIGGVTDCWVKDVNIINADSGIFCRGHHCTIQGITLTAPNTKAVKSKSPYTKGTTGHHGITAGGTYNLFSNFTFDTIFIHDLTISRCAGNVFMNGKGINLAFDHHKKAPFANLFTNIDLGKGTRFLLSGGGTHIGRHSAAWQTFWNVRSEQPVYINPEFGPVEMNFVGIKASNEKQLKEKGFHVESSPVAPLNLYEAQRARFQND